ncbi:MAG: LapA family protein [Candidatus Marinimicrobia bacterium]|nr:LapA family protein [Candidatus Neomarinimicrobiota bacterium]MCF7850166.1 LapA family protein [Candidatus Neomarinimicrobiota bacterium]MCF7905149.1 LapA family protein [Candidatus Neomarinimicrobiota bacterium]
MKELKIFITVAIILSVVWIFTQNATPVELKLMGAVYPGIPLYVVILGSVILGMLFGFSITIGQNIKLRKGLRLIDREREKLQGEVDKRRQAVLDEDEGIKPENS